jgi:hypothetical protein
MTNNLNTVVKLSVEDEVLIFGNGDSMKVSFRMKNGQVTQVRKDDSNKTALRKLEEHCQSLPMIQNGKKPYHVTPKLYIEGLIRMEELSPRFVNTIFWGRRRIIQTKNNVIQKTWIISWSFLLV